VRRLRTSHTQSMKRVRVRNLQLRSRQLGNAFNLALITVFFTGHALNPRPAPQKRILHNGERPSNTSVPADLWNIPSGKSCCNQLVNANVLHPPTVAGISNSPISHGPGQFLGNHVLQWHL